MAYSTSAGWHPTTMAVISAPAETCPLTTVLRHERTTARAMGRTDRRRPRRDRPTETTGRAAVTPNADYGAAQLGLATTEELIRELIARFTVHYAHDEVGQRRNTERALMLAELLGGLAAVDREYRTASPTDGSEGTP